MGTADDDRAAYGRNFIFERRSALGLSQADIAAALDVSTMAVSRWERLGVLTVQELGMLAEVLKCTPAELVPGPPPPPPLAPEETQLLAWFRGVGPSERRSITTLARALAESESPTLDIRKPAAG